MRVFVMFDLPQGTSKQRREYSLFRKYLVKSGFLMLQESVYCKLAPNTVAGESIVSGVISNKPPEGLVQVLKITEKQYEKMECIVGNASSEVLNSDERLVIL